jgi:Cu/Ag efflux protein CusF
MTVKHAITASWSVIFLLGIAACAIDPEPVAETPTASEVVSDTPHVARAFGSVLQRDLNTRILEITHAPVPEADWPIMQMEFYVSNEIDLANYVPGDAVEFIFNYAVEQTPVIIAMRRTSAQELIGAMWPKAIPEDDTETE